MKARWLVVVLFLACAVVARADVASYPVSDDEEYLLELLATGDERDRQSALSGLMSAATDRSVPALFEIMETANLREAAEAVRILGKIGDHQAAPAILKRLEETLEAYTPPPPPPDVSGLSSEEAWEVLREQDDAGDLSFYQSRFIEQACMALGRVSPEDALAVLPGIIDARTETMFTYSAFLGLGYTGDDRAVPIIVEKLTSLRDMFDVRSVVDALVLIGSKTAVDTLCGLITDPLTPHRGEVVVDAGRAIHNPRTYYGAENPLDREETRQLEEAIWWVGTEDPDPEYRLLALMTMAVNYQNTDEETERLLDLIEAETGTYPISLKTDYGLVFKNFQGQHRELTGRLLAGALEKASAKDDIIPLLKELENLVPKYDPQPPPEGLWSLLVGFTGDSEAELRGTCLRPLANIYGLEAAPYVLDAFDDPSPGVRWEAADVYVSYELADAGWDTVRGHLSGFHRESAYDFILDAVNREDNRSVYEVMVKALVSTRDPRAVEVLSGIFEGAAPDDRNTRLAMLQMLYSMNLPEANAAITRLAETDKEKRYIGLRETPPREISDPEVLLKNYIENPDSRYRGRAALRYAELVGPEAVDVILDYLPTEADPRERVQGYIGLRHTESPIPVERLLHLLEKEDSPRILTEAIGLLPDEYSEITVTFLTGKLEDEFAARVDGSHPMFQQKSEDPFASNDYDDFNYNDSYAKLMRKLAGIAPTVAHPILLDIYRNDPVEESRAAAYDLALTTDPAGVVELIREGLESPDAGVRYNALRAVPEYLGDEAVGIVTRFVDDSGFEVKFAAIRMIVDLLGPDAAEIIAPQLESPSWYISDLVGKYLANWGDPRAFDYYYGLWDGRVVHKLTDTIIGNLAKYDDPRGWEVIREVCEIGGRSNEVYYAWLLRAERGDPEAREFFLSMVDEEEPQFTGTDTLFEGLRWFSDDEVRAVIERIATDETEHWFRRDLAWEVLAFWSDPKAVDYLMERFNNEENPRREYMLTALSNFDNPAVWELIRDAAENDPDWLVVKEAQKQLKKRDGE